MSTILKHIPNIKLTYLPFKKFPENVTEITIYRNCRSYLIMIPHTIIHLMDMNIDRVALNKIMASL